MGEDELGQVRPEVVEAEWVGFFDRFGFFHVILETGGCSGWGFYREREGEEREVRRLREETKGWLRT